MVSNDMGTGHDAWPVGGLSADLCSLCSRLWAGDGALRSQQMSKPGRAWMDIDGHGCADDGEMHSQGDANRDWQGASRQSPLYPHDEN